MSAIPSRADFYGEYPAGSKKAVTAHHTAFGWKVMQHKMPAGAVMILHSTAEVDRAKVPNLNMYVAGRSTVVCDGVDYPDRVPGMCSQERPAHPAGITKVTAVEDTEFWCFNYTLNKRSLPTLTPIRLAAAETVMLTAGQKVFVMAGKAGDVEGPCTLVPEAETTLTADTAVYAFVIAEEKQ